MSRTGKDTPDLFSALDSGAAALNNARVVRDAQRADHESRSAPPGTTGGGTVRPRLAFVAALLVFWALGITARLVYLQVFQYDDADRAGRETAEPDDRYQPAARVRSSIGTAACSRTASTPT